MHLAVAVPVTRQGVKTAQLGRSPSSNFQQARPEKGIFATSSRRGDNSFQMLRNAA